jgi:hypothetical protein
VWNGFLLFWVIDNQQIFASQYQLYLPSEAQLLAEVRKELARFRELKGVRRPLSIKANLYWQVAKVVTPNLSILMTN